MRDFLSCVVVLLAVGAVVQVQGIWDDNAIMNLFRKTKTTAKPTKAKARVPITSIMDLFKKKTTTKSSKAKKTVPITLPTISPKPSSPIQSQSSDKVRAEQMKISTQQQLLAYLKVSKEMSMKIKSMVIKDPPPPKQTVIAQSGSGVPDCSCVPTYTRKSLPEHRSHLGVYIPSSCIATYECGGGCLFPEFQECAAVDSITITHNIIFYYFPHIKIKPADFEVQQHNVLYHKSCACKCKKKDCHPRKFFNENFCDCKCKPEYDVKCQLPYKFDEKTCRCYCPFKDDYVCPIKTQVLDKSSCKCKCPHGQALDHRGSCSKISMSNGK